MTAQPPEPGAWSGPEHAARGRRHGMYLDPAQLPQTLAAPATDAGQPAPPAVAPGGDLEHVLTHLRFEVTALRADLVDAVGDALAAAIAEVRKASTPEGMAELAQLARDVATGAKDGAVVLAWLAAHGL